MPSGGVHPFSCGPRPAAPSETAAEIAKLLAPAPVVEDRLDPTAYRQPPHERAQGCSARLQRCLRAGRKRVAQHTRYRYTPPGGARSASSSNSLISSTFPASRAESGLAVERHFDRDWHQDAPSASPPQRRPRPTRTTPGIAHRVSRRNPGLGVDARPDAVCRECSPGGELGRQAGRDDHGVDHVDHTVRRQDVGGDDGGAAVEGQLSVLQR